MNIQSVFGAVSNGGTNYSNTAGQQAAPRDAAAGGSAPNGGNDQAQNNLLIQKLNERLAAKDQEVVYDYDKVSNRIWLNVIDKTTGKVVEKIPPEVIRELIDSLETNKGLAIDTAR